MQSAIHPANKTRYSKIRKVTVCMVRPYLGTSTFPQ